jgi:hypothetical protein
MDAHMDPSSINFSPHHSSCEWSPFTEPDWQEQKNMRSLELINSLDTFLLRCGKEGLLHIPLIYQTLFHRTKTYAATVRKLVAATSGAPAKWADAACLLVDWSINILRHPSVGFEKFLHSQRESIYWILDDALLRICVEKWDVAPCSRTLWDEATASLRLAIRKAERRIPGWVAREYEELQKWVAVPSIRLAEKEIEVGYFRRSRMFLRHSTRVNELWRTMRLCAKGQLPAELANVIVEDVSRFEGLPMGDLGRLYLPKNKEEYVAPVRDPQSKLPISQWGAPSEWAIRRVKGLSL